MLRPNHSSGNWNPAVKDVSMLRREGRQSSVSTSASCPSELLWDPEVLIRQMKGLMQVEQHVNLDIHSLGMHLLRPVYVSGLTFTVVNKT